VREHYEKIREAILSHRLTYGQSSSYILAKGDIPKELDGSSGYLWYDWRSVENKYLGVLATTEMLLQSQNGKILVLPSLSKELPSGKVTGLCARGGFELSFEWSNGKLTKLEILSKAGLPCYVTINKEFLNPGQSNIINLETTKGDKYLYTF